MKVLFISNYYDGTGYSQAGIDMILSLDAAGVDVVPRPLKFNNANIQPPKRVLELEAKSSAGCDVCIQHTLPHKMDFNGRFAKNIGLFASETSNFKNSHWPEHLNSMDEVWVINDQMVEACRASGVVKPITVIPHATDVERFTKNYKVLPQLAQYKKQGDFLFYFVGEMNRRKNLAALVKAFNTEFDRSEPVQLVIKTSDPGKSAEECKVAVHDFCDKLKSQLRLYEGRPESFKREVVITERLSETDMCSLHNTADCFVACSYGEAWCIPAMDAMGFGKTPIVTGWGGFTGYISNETGWLVNSHQDMVFGLDHQFTDLYTADETWASIDIVDLRRCMREAFTNHDLRNQKSLKGISRAFDFSHEEVGALMKAALNQ